MGEWEQVMPGGYWVKRSITIALHQLYQFFQPFNCSTNKFFHLATCASCQTEEKSPNTAKPFSLKLSR